MITANKAALAILRIYLMLLALLFATAAAYRLPPGWYSTPISMAAATAKLLLIFYFYMHLGRQKPLVRVFAAAGFVWLAILLVLTATDYMTRGCSF
ncbi:MAG TPA: cytochrome C oxidase subunit IV family protein [Opitutaceae bacterium]|jgi:cytochrome c oxidase subunit 4|nr:cytochrome C oxidase subunit IV family protein [Opitutaceae bacterium]